MKSAFRLKQSAPLLQLSQAKRQVALPCWLNLLTWRSPIASCASLDSNRAKSTGRRSKSVRPNKSTLITGTTMRMISGSILILAAAVMFSAISVGPHGGGQAEIFYPMLGVGLAGTLVFAWGIATD